VEDDPRFDKGSRTYHYSDVPPGTFHGLISAPSPGAYVNSSIAYNFSYEHGPAPETSLIEDALDLPDLSDPVAIAETAAEVATPEVRAMSWIARFGAALRRMMPW
jgi:hypothetical protein